MTSLVHEAFCLDSLQNQVLWFDDFEGDQLKDHWVLGLSAGGSGAVVDGVDGGICRLTTHVDPNDYAELFWNDVRSLTVAKKVCMEVRMKLGSASNILGYCFLMSAADWLNYLMIGANTNLYANWFFRSRSDGVTTEVASTIAIDVNWHIFRIVAHTHGANHVHYFLDGAEFANSPISTNVPSVYLQPRPYTQALIGANSIDIDYVYICQDR